MAQVLVKLYDFVKANGGPTAQMRLAMKTMIPLNKAGEVPDSPDTIARFRAAIKEVTGKDAPSV